MSLARTLCVLLLALHASGCAKRHKPPAAPVQANVAPEPPPRRGVCFAPRDPNAYAYPVRPHDWLSVLTRLELGRGGVYATRDCTGRVIRYAQPRNCSTPKNEPAPVLSPMAEEAVIVRDLGSNIFVVWVVTHRFQDGDGYGPIALARRQRDGIEIAAMGMLRMRTQRVKLESFSLKGQNLIIATGETCRRGPSDQSCERSSRIVLGNGEQLVDAPVVDPEGRCLQEGNFELARLEQRVLPSGLTRSFQYTANVTHDAKYVVVEERLLVRDLDANGQGAPAREVQRIETNRLFEPTQGRLITRQNSLWSKAIDRARELPSGAQRSMRP
jgi:hypothetical protein